MPFTGYTHNSGIDLSKSVGIWFVAGFRPASFLALLLLVFATTSCTRYSEVPVSHYSTLEDSTAYGYRVTTLSGRYKASRLAVTDSVLVVLATRADVGISVGDSIPFTEIELVERIELDPWPPILVVATITMILAWLTHIGDSFFGGL